ncbi:MAG: alkaline phosphatase D family protein [Pirellulales bacterium]
MNKIIRTALLGLFFCTSSLLAQNNAGPVTHGPMLGHVTSNSVRVWVRTHQSGDFHINYGTDPENLDQKSIVGQTEINRDNTGFVEITGLDPHTKYYYDIETRSTKAKGGTFRTLRDAKALVDAELNPRGLHNFSFEFACGNNQNPEHGIGPSLPVYDTLLSKVKDDIDFAILNGDWLYEDQRDYPIEAWRKKQNVFVDKTPATPSIAPTIVGVWENYKTYMHRGKNLAEWHKHIPTYYTFDDHELLNDVFGCGTPGYRNRRAVFRDIGIQAWQDYLGWSNPMVYKNKIHFGKAKFTKDSNVLVDESTDFTKIDWDTAANLHVHWGTKNAGVKDIPEGDTEGGDPNANIYEVVRVIDKHRVEVSPTPVATGQASYSIGKRSYGHFRVANCDFWILDTRTHRQKHDTKNPAMKGLSMLGKHQTEWLLNGMKKSDADFHFVVSSVNFMVPHVGGGGHAFDTATKDDAWTVFLEEREHLIDTWNELDARVFVLTGDLHNSFAINITDNVWEFASGPHNSVNHRPEDEGMRPVNGKFKYGPRECDIRWSSVARADIPRENRLFPHYCVVQINNVYNNPIERDGERLIEFPIPHVIFQYYDAFTGKLKYAQPIHALPKKKPASE